MENASSKLIKAKDFSKAPKKMPDHLSRYVHMVNEAAYYRALLRGFTPGYELLDWLIAEEEVLSRLFHLNLGDKTYKGEHGGH